MKIRIGNDICLRISLFHDEDKPVNIKRLRAYFINRTLQKKLCRLQEIDPRFVRRFPIEPCAKAYSSTEWNINSGGYPYWAATPRNIHTYVGFGCRPDWNYIYPHRRFNPIEYRAPIKDMGEPNMFEIFFPAKAQLFTGDYALIVVAELYVDGYGFNNIKTVTVDKEDVFTLVSTSEEGIDGDVVIDVDKVDIDDQIIPTDDIHVQSGSVNEQNIQLQLNNGLAVDVPFGDVFDWNEED